MFIQLALSNPSFYFMWIVIVIFSVCVHELSHAICALSQGDYTAKELGYITFNPLKFMGLTSIITLCLIGVTWGATPVNPNRMRHKYSHALVAFSGPMANLVLFALFSFLLALSAVMTGSSSSTVSIFTSIGATLNVVLFILNMIPVPPLDGWTIFTYFFPRVHNINRELRNGAIFGIFILAFFYSHYLLKIGSSATMWLTKVFAGVIS